MMDRNIREETIDALVEQYADNVKNNATQPEIMLAYDAYNQGYLNAIEELLRSITKDAVTLSRAIAKAAERR